MNKRLLLLSNHKDYSCHTRCVVDFKYFNTETCHFYKSFIENDTDYCCKMEKYCAFMVFGLPYALANAVYLSSAVV